MPGNRTVEGRTLAEDDFVHVGPVVKAETLGLLKDGDDYLERCRQQADTLLRETEAQCATLREDARKAGYSQGYEDAKAAVLARVMHLDRVFGDQGPLVAELVRTCFERVIGQLDTKFFPARLVEKVLTQIRAENQIVVHVSKRQTRQVRKALALLRAEHPGCSEIAVCGHDLVATDEIVVEASDSYFRWNKDKTLQAIERCLNEVFAQTDDPTTDG